MYVYIYTQTINMCVCISKENGYKKTLEQLTLV